MFDLRAICDDAAHALREASVQRDLEQSPYGLDALDELGLHDILRAGFRARGWGVQAEVRFPAHGARRKRSEGDRCDIVLTESPDLRVAEQSVAGTLFSSLACAPEEALWIEVKVAAQHAIVDGVAMPNRGYSSQLLQAATRDIRKLAADANIEHAAVLLVLFTEAPEITEHDITAWAHRCLDNNLPIGAPITSGFEIADRIGNAWCAASLCKVSCGQD